MLNPLIMKHLHLFTALLLSPLSLFCQDIFRPGVGEEVKNKPAYVNPIVFSVEQPASSVHVAQEHFLNDFTLKSTVKSTGEIDFDTCMFSNAVIGSPDLNLALTGCHFKNVRIVPTQDQDSRDSYSGFIYLDNMQSDGNLEISDISICRPVRISGTLKGALKINDVTCLGADAIIDLSGLKPYDTAARIALNLKGAPLTNISLKYKYFQIDNSLRNDPQTIVIYRNLLDAFRNNGQTDNYQLLDIEYQHYMSTQTGTGWHIFWGTISDFIAHYWWNYGYDKGRVLLWTLVFLLVFSLINWPLHNQLREKIYPVKELPQNTSFYNSLIYTCIIFFSVSLDVNRLKFQNKGYLAWFLFVFVVGLICVAYTINFVLKAGESFSSAG